MQPFSHLQLALLYEIASRLPGGSRAHAFLRPALGRYAHFKSPFGLWSDGTVVAENLTDYRVNPVEDLLAGLRNALWCMPESSLDGKNRRGEVR